MLSGGDSGILCCPGAASDTDRPSYPCLRCAPNWPNSALCLWWVLCRRTIPTLCPVAGGLPSSRPQGALAGDRVCCPCPSGLASCSSGSGILEGLCAFPHTSFCPSVLQALTPRGALCLPPALSLSPGLLQREGSGVEPASGHTSCLGGCLRFRFRPSPHWIWQFSKIGAAVFLLTCAFLVPIL